MPIVLAPLICFLLGVVFAWISRRELVRAGRGRKSMMRATMFAVLVVGPVVAYAPAFHGDWSYLYLVSSDRIPSAVDLVLVCLSVGACVVGHVAAMRAVTGKRPDRVVWLALPAFLVLALAVALTSRRLAMSGTTAQFRGEFGLVPTSQSRLARGLALGWLAIASGLVFNAWAARRSR